MQSLAVIGAGPSGLAAAKTALECGLMPTVFEKTDKIGGVWRDQTGSVWDSMRTNLSYHSCAFSDMPWERPSDSFPNQQEVYQYLDRYAQTNELYRHIRFTSTVTAVTQVGEKWKLEWSEQGTVEQRVFDFVIVASGIFSKPFIPQIAGLSTYTGERTHSQYYRNPSAYKDKVVAVIGNSFSGTEISAEISTQAKKTIHIASKAMWVLPRNLPVGNATKPLDLVFYNRDSVAKAKSMTQAQRNERTYRWFMSITMQHEVCRELAIEALPTNPAYVAISDTYLEQVRRSKIELVRSQVNEVVANTLLFEDGTRREVDALVFATGYECELLFFDSKVLRTLEFMPEDHLQPLLLHACMFHPDLSNLAFVGMYRGPYFATMELQARLACHIFAKMVPSLSRETMLAGIESERMIREQVPRPQFPHGNYVEFADSLAELAGVLPDFEKLQVSNPELYKTLQKGPLIAAHYRLSGPASKPEIAMELIEAANKAQ